jgi:hypothetical protein
VLNEGTADPGKVIDFSRLSRNLVPVGRDDGGIVNLGEADQGIRASGLISCAAVCFLNTVAGVGYVYHANVGDVPRGTFDTIMDDIGARALPRYAGAAVAYAHQDASDRGYDNAVRDLRNWLDQGQLVQITHLPLNEFGMNGHFQIGY